MARKAEKSKKKKNKKKLDKYKINLNSRISLNTSDFGSFCNRCKHPPTQSCSSSPKKISGSSLFLIIEFYISLISD